MIYADSVSEFADKVGVPITVAVIGLAATVAAAAISFALGRWSDTTSRRRDGYAEATRELVAWAEYPFRIRRRSSDAGAELNRLADLGHNHQQALRYRETWIRAEDPWVGAVFREVRQELAAILGPACVEAWNTPPIADATGMVLGDWGPQGVDVQIARFEKAIEVRFGWRRVAALVRLRPSALRRSA